MLIGAPEIGSKKRKWIPDLIPCATEITTVVILFVNSKAKKVAMILDMRQRGALRSTLASGAKKPSSNPGGYQQREEVTPSDEEKALRDIVL